MQTNVLITSRPLFRRLFAGRLTVGFCGHARPYRPMLWHNPRWTRLRVGTHRHYIAYQSRFMYRRMCRHYARQRPSVA